MRVAFIEPIAELSYCLLTDMQMILPEACNLDPEYRDFYRHIGQAHYKILDNGNAEGEEIPWGDLLALGAYMGVNEIVVPDVMGESGPTQRKAWEFHNWLSKQSKLTTSAFNYMGVAHGKNMADVVSCIQTMAEIPSITTLGLPRLIANTIHKHIRCSIMESPDLLSLIAKGFPQGVHCLGSSNYPKEAILLADLPVRSIDTSFVANMTFAGKNIGHDEPVARPKAFWDATYDTNEEVLGHINHAKYLDWCRGTNASKGGV